MDELIKAGLKARPSPLSRAHRLLHQTFHGVIPEEVVGAVTYSKQDAYERRLHCRWSQDENAFHLRHCHACPGWQRPKARRRAELN